MKHSIPLAALLSTCLCFSIAGAVTLNLKSGYVRYEVRLKTLGIGGDEVSALNRGVIGKVTLTDEGRVEGGLVVPVVGFDSNNSKRDKDVANILRYKQHPAITFEVVDISPTDIQRILQPDSGTATIQAKISAAGGSKVYDVVLGFRPEGEGAIEFTMRIDAKFSDFGIDPPRLGLILKTAPDKIELSGDLVFSIEKEGQTPP